MRKYFQIAAASLLLSLPISGSAHAGGVFIATAPAPVYYPVPYYTAPAPVAYAPPAPYYYYPAAPVYYSAPVVVAPRPVYYGYSFGWWGGHHHHWH